MKLVFTEEEVRVLVIESLISKGLVSAEDKFEATFSHYDRDMLTVKTEAVIKTVVEETAAAVDEEDKPINLDDIKFEGEE